MRNSYLYSFIALALGLPVAGTNAASPVPGATETRPATQQRLASPVFGATQGGALRREGTQGPAAEVR